MARNAFLKPGVTMQRIDNRSPMFTNRALINLGFPILLNCLMSFLMGTVDSIMVSAAGAAAVSAVSIVDAINAVFTTVFDSIPIGGSVVTSQYLGAKQYEKAKESIRQILYSGVVLALICMVSMLCLRRQVLNWIYGTIEVDVYQQAVTYFTITLLSYPFLVAGCTATATLRSMAKSRQAVTITISVNALNVVGNAVLIYGFHLGVAGAAAATVFSRIVWCVWGLLALRSKKLSVQLDRIFPIRLDWSVLKRVLLVGMGNGFENGLFYVGRLLVSSLVASLGTVYIAAYSLSSTLSSFGWSALSAFTTTAMTVVGICIGAGEKEQARQNAKKMLLWSSVSMVVLFSLVFVFRRQLVGLYKLKTEELEVAAYYTGVAAVLTVITGYSMSFTPVGVFRAAGDLRYPVVLASATMILFRVGLSYLLCLYFEMGLMGVWLGMGADWLCRTIFNTVHFCRGKWLDKKLI